MKLDIRLHRPVPPASTFAHGFTLTEMAVVLVIIALLIGGMILPLASQDDIRRSNETQATLRNVLETLTGYALVNGRLPCPAWDGSGADATNTLGRESFAVSGTAANGICGHFHDGYIPAVDLGVGPVDSQGFLLDAWGNRIRYAVSKDPTDGTMSTNAASTPRYSFTMTSGINGTGRPGMAAIHPDLHVCDTGAASATKQCAATTLSASAIAVILSTGKNTGRGGVGVDEAANLDGDRSFVDHPPRPLDLNNNEFDDLVAMLSPNTYINRMVTAGRLP